MYANEDGALDHEALADDLASAVHGFPAWNLKEVTAWFAERLHSDPHGADTPVLLAATFLARFPVAYTLNSAAAFDALLGALERITSTAGCAAPGAHSHPTLAGIEESGLLHGPDELAEVVRMMGDRTAWDDYFTDEPPKDAPFANFDGWRCPEFTAMLAAHTVEELRLWGRERFEPVDTGHLDDVYLTVSGEADLARLGRDIQDRGTSETQALHAALWAADRLLAGALPAEKPQLLDAVCAMSAHVRVEFATPPRIVAGYKDALEMIDTAPLRAACGHADGHPSAGAEDAGELRCPRRLAEAAKAALDGITFHYEMRSY